MTSSHLISWVIGTALTFRVVGACNRLVRFRGNIVRQFAPTDVQFKLHQALLPRQIDALAPTLANAGPPLDALRTACQQADLAAQLGATDSTLAFARGQFNAAVQACNHAVQQLPTRLVAGLFGLHPTNTP